MGGGSAPPPSQSELAARADRDREIANKRKRAAADLEFRRRMMSEFSVLTTGGTAGARRVTGAAA